jgi:hypothetical protein
MLHLSIKLPQPVTGIAKSPIDVFHRQPSLAKLTWARGSARSALAVDLQVSMSLSYQNDVMRLRLRGR